MSTMTTQILVGREKERQQLRAALRAGRNVLLEGPVGAGKTHLANTVTQELGRPVFRVDGDSRYTEQKLSGAFDPPTVLKKGFSEEAFIPGPLVQAMRAGGVLFINELNRLPEGVQNILLPAVDEKFIYVPRLGEVKAAPGFVVVATQNPKEFVATSHLSEAILDRFELVTISYQTEQEERQIVQPRVAQEKESERLARVAVRVARLTRTHPRIRRGASVRAAISVAELAASFLKDGLAFADAVLASVQMALPTRIEIEREADSDQSHAREVQKILEAISQQALSEGDLPEKKA
jgi:MoxR-like ATPase